MQAMGDVSKVMETGDLAQKVSSFGFNVISVDGHNISELIRCKLFRWLVVISLTLTVDWHLRATIIISNVQI